MNRWSLSWFAAVAAVVVYGLAVVHAFAPPQPARRQQQRPLRRMELQASSTTTPPKRTTTKASYNPQKNDPYQRKLQQQQRHQKRQATEDPSGVMASSLSHQQRQHDNKEPHAPHDETTTTTTTAASSYVPSGLTRHEYQARLQHELDLANNKDYAAWGPRFCRSDQPVSSDMAWMTNPDLWTLGYRDSYADEEDVRDEDAPLPLGKDDDDDDLGMFRRVRLFAWEHATNQKEEEEWKTIYNRFCGPERCSIHELVMDKMAKEQQAAAPQNMIADPRGPPKVTAEQLQRTTLLTCRYARHVLHGLTVHGNADVSLMLRRLAQHCAPTRSDWDALRRVETKVWRVDVAAVPDHGKVGDNYDAWQLAGTTQTRADFVQDILALTDNEDNDDDDDHAAAKQAAREMYLEQMTAGDRAELGLCLDWYLALRRMGVGVDDDPWALAQEAEEEEVVDDATTADKAGVTH